MLQGQGGAVAVVAPTGLSVNQDASRLNLRLMQLLRANAAGGHRRPVPQALADHVAQDNPATQPAIYNLIGDPATAYNVAPAAVDRHRRAAIHGGDREQRRAGDHLVGRQSRPTSWRSNPPCSRERLWETLGAPVTGTSATVPMTGTAGFIRVRGSQ